MFTPFFRMKAMKLQKNKEIQLHITAVTGEGNGVGRYPQDDPSGMAVFVPFSAVGDRAVCRVQKVEKRFAYGRITQLETASPDRCQGDERFCPVYEKCGGCVWRHVTYEAEANYKWQKVRDALQRIGGFSLQPRPIVAADVSDRYRNKAQFPLERQENGIVAGFYAPRSHRVIACEDCRLQPLIFKEIVQLILHWAEEHNISIYDEREHKGLLRHIYLRLGEATGEVMVCLVATSGKIPFLSVLSERLQEAFPAVKTLVVNINRQETNVVLGDSEYAVFGDGTITDTLLGLQFKLSPRSFYQVNHAQTEKLYQLVADAADLQGGETLLDLYCGTGTIGLTMAKKVGQLIGADIVAPAIENAKRNAHANGITNARFICADAAKAAKQLKKEGIRPDVVVVDPPRKGCDTALLNTIIGMAPPKLVYVSCDPATLARDLKYLNENGYTVQTVTPVDMFPGTSHVETVCLLSKN